MSWKLPDAAPLASSLLTTRKRKQPPPPPPSSFLLIFPSTFFFTLGNPPPQSLWHIQPTYYIALWGGPANPNNNLDPILPEHLSAKCSHKTSKPHTGIMLNFDGWSHIQLQRYYKSCEGNGDRLRAPSLKFPKTSTDIEIHECYFTPVCGVKRHRTAHGIFQSQILYALLCSVQWENVSSELLNGPLFRPIDGGCSSGNSQTTKVTLQTQIFIFISKYMYLLVDIRGHVIDRSPINKQGQKHKELWIRSFSLLIFDLPQFTWIVSVILLLRDVIFFLKKEPFVKICQVCEWSTVQRATEDSPINNLSINRVWPFSQAFARVHVYMYAQCMRMSKHMQ